MRVLITSGMKAHVNRVNEKPDEYGCLVTPRCRSSINRTRGIIGVDNDRFNDCYTDQAFIKTLMYLANFKGKDRIKFIATPDIPFNSEGTLQDFYTWYPVIKKIFKLPIALVTQDGISIKSIDWERIDAIFVGGTTEYKMSQESINIIKKAKSLDKWVHVGRVNTAPRFTFFSALGVDSIDGTAFSLFQEEQIKLYESVIKQDIFPDLFANV